MKYSEDYMEMSNQERVEAGYDLERGFGVRTDSQQPLVNQPKFLLNHLGVPVGRFPTVRLRNKPIRQEVVGKQEARQRKTHIDKIKKNLKRR